MPLSPDIQLQPHQQALRDDAAAAADADTPFRRMAIWGTGSGKTIGALGAADALGVPAAVVAPAAVRPSFQLESQRALGTKIPVVSYHGAASGRLPPADTLIVDEAQRLNSPGAQATAVTDLAQQARNVLLLSGTPIRNHPRELAAAVSILSGKSITPEEFGDRYIGTERHRPGGILGWLRGEPAVEQPAITHADELKDLLRGKIDYYESRNPKPGEPSNVHYQDVESTMLPSQAQLYSGMFEKLPFYLRWKLKWQYPLTDSELVRARSFLSGPRQVGLSDLPWRSDRDPLGAFENSGKLREAMRRLETTLGDPRTKAIVYSNFLHAGLRPYSAALTKAKIPHAIFHGSLSDEERRRMVSDFNSGKTRVALVAPAGAEGISLKGAQLIQLLDPHWNDARMRQAQARGIRFDSHMGLPEDLRNVTVERHVAKLPLGMADRLMASIGFDREAQRAATDDYLRALSTRKERLNRQFTDFLREIANENQARRTKGADVIDLGELMKSARDEIAQYDPGDRYLLASLGSLLPDLQPIKVSRTVDEPRHICISGHSGSGKSTTARRLAARTKLPVHEIDEDHDWRHSDVKDDPERFTPGTAAFEAFEKLRRKLVGRALANDKPHIIAGCQLLVDPSLLRGHRVVLIDTPEDQVVDQRLKRDVEKGKLRRHGHAKRVAKAKYLIEKLGPEVDKFRELADVEKVPADDVDDWVDAQPRGIAASHRQPRTVLVDVDGTLTEPGKWKGSGQFHPIRPGAAEFVQSLKDEGLRVIIWTCRGDEDALEKWLKHHKVPFDHINENPDQPPDASPKLYAHAYIGDDAIHADGDWDKIKRELLRRFENDGHHEKSSGTPKTVHALSGRLIHSASGWGLLEVPNDLVHGAFKALDDPDAELPPSHGERLRAHISVLRPEDIERIGGAGKISEFGRRFRFTLGPVQKVKPDGWSEMDWCYFIEVKSPELEDLRESYGLSRLPKDDDHEFHITIAVVRAKAKAAAAAPGIPDRGNPGDHTRLPVNELVRFIAQHHQARRAGPHTDLRLHVPGYGALSWATKKELPGPGERPISIFRQPLHSEAYSDFQGEIPQGYGAGKVTTKSRGEALVTKVTPDSIHLTLAHTGDPHRLIFKKVDDKQWLAIPATSTQPIEYQKQRYRKIPAEKAEQVLQGLQPGASVQAKIDGAASLTRLLDGKYDVASYRAAAGSGNPIIHTERMSGSRPEVAIPPELRGSVLRGELFGVGPKGRAIPPQELGGLLNAGLAKSLRTQQERGIQLKNLVFDITHRGGQPVGRDVLYSQRLQILRDVLQQANLPKDKFVLPQEAKTPQEAIQLWNQIQTGKHPLTEEGVIVHPPTGVPAKIKLLQERDVYPTGVFPGEGKYQGNAAGGFDYATSPGGPVAGRVGTGFTDETRRQMWSDPSAFLGQIARVRHQGAFPSGALRAPSYIGPHLDLPLAKAADAFNDQMKQIKTFSDQQTAESYAKKTQLLQQAIAASPQEWIIDSELNPEFVGVTHQPSGWRFHMRKRDVAGLLPPLGA